MEKQCLRQIRSLAIGTREAMSWVLEKPCHSERREESGMAVPVRDVEIPRLGSE